MKTKTIVKRHGKEWVFVVKDYDGNCIHKFRCNASSKKEAEEKFKLWISTADSNRSN